MLTPLRAILKAAAKSLGVGRAVHAARVEELWPEVAGDEAAAHTRPGGLRGGVLIVDAEPGPWAQELTAQRARFIQEINRRLGEAIVEEIRFRQRAGVSGIRQRGGTPEIPAAGEAEPRPEELAAIDRVIAEIADPEVREAARRAMVSQLRWRKRGNAPTGRGDTPDAARGRGS